MKAQVLDARRDPMGAAIADFYKNGIAGRLRVLSSMFDEDEIPVAHLFREEDEMGELELKALELSKEYKLYRQEYCGCVYSMEERNIKH